MKILASTSGVRDHVGSDQGWWTCWHTAKYRSAAERRLHVTSGNAARPRTYVALAFGASAEKLPAASERP